MKIIELEQGSDAWLAWRRSHITATDAAVILGHSPWKTPLELWEEKLGLRDPAPMNDAMRRGQELEPEAREIASRELQYDFLPCVVEHSHFSLMGASLDGLGNHSSVILEIKCPGEGSHESHIECGPPMHYLMQMMHQMAVTSAPFGFFMSYRPEHDNPYIFHKIMRDDAFIEKMIAAEREFYDCLVNMKAPETWTLKEKK